MEYKPPGKTDLKVSELCFGTMTFGDGTDEASCRAIYARCRDAGINIRETISGFSLKPALPTDRTEEQL